MSQTPRTEAAKGFFDLDSAVSAEFASELETETENYIYKIQNAIKSLEELPRLVLEDERKNPSWSRAELWGIERDIVPTIHLRCLQIIADLKDNSPISPKTP